MKVSMFGRTPSLAGLAAACLWLTQAGCSMTKLVADQTAGMVQEGAPALDAMEDYEVAGLGIPGGIVQLETFLHISPDNPKLGLNLAKAYVGYALGWVEHQYDLADTAGNLELADERRAQARRLHLRGRDLALHQLAVRNKGIEKAIRGDEEELKKFLAKAYKKKSDAAALFWCGSGWGAAIDMSRDQPDLIVELPIAKALVARAKELDESYYNYGPGMFLGAVEASLPQAMGGNPAAGKALFDEALEKSDRKNLMIQFQYARTYAVNTQNKELFEKLLHEVIDAPDLGPATRLPNAIARVRAKLWLEKRGQNLF
jgi:hypothetical protein